ncbi:tyrosine-type recombinase/integrase [Roseateles sp. DAIF2]|uniref:tyrosine-type recombinase/integrase n=1 Tax=Roseateles sp. DAIF2 TaxID=2714952 RepID=UPI00201DAB02|nr:tyrosine-type recombinase/integrase [Roseateles sp. DAIF2]
MGRSDQWPGDVLKIKREDLRDGALWIVQNKTKAKRAIELAALIERINARPRERLSAWLIQDDDGKPLGTFGLRSRFDKARRAAGVEFQFRDIQAKAATNTGDLAHSQKLLGHRNREMTEHYERARVGERVQPLR